MNRAQDFSVHRRSLYRRMLPALLSLFVLLYFCYHFVSGARGLTALNEMKAHSTLLEQRLSSLREEKNAIIRRVSLLKSTALDVDMVDEQSRRLLGYAEEGEIVIMLPLPSTSPNRFVAGLKVR